MLEDYFFTKNTKWVLWGAFAVIVALLIFHAGVVVGSHQPTRGRMVIGGPGGMFGGPGNLMPNLMPAQGYLESGHGAVGTVATVTLPTFTLTARDGTMEIVDTSTSTTVTGGASGTLSDLKSGEGVIVIGDPKDNGDNDLDARIIHILSN